MIVDPSKTSSKSVLISLIRVEKHQKRSRSVTTPIYSLINGVKENAIFCSKVYSCRPEMDLTSTGLGTLEDLIANMCLSGAFMDAGLSSINLEKMANKYLK